MSQEKSGCTYPGCDRKLLETSKGGYCIFHAKPEEKDTREFNEALENYINEIEAKELDYNFSGFVFVGSIDFARHFKVTVFKNASFVGAEFQGNAYFWTTKFQGHAYFGGAEFQGDANFWGVEFHGETYFQDVKFHKGAVFWRTKFQGNVTFLEPEFQGRANFAAAEFWAVASILPKFMRGEVLFAYATLENASLTPLNLDKTAWIDFKKARLRNTQISREDIDGHVIQEQRKDFSNAKEIYLLLKNNFHTIGRYDDESWAFRKEKEMERKSFWHFRKEHKERELGKEWSNKGIKDCFYLALLDFECTAKYLRDYWFPTSWKKINRLFSCGGNFPKHPIANIKGELKNLMSFVAANKQKEIGNMSRKELSKALWFYIKYPIKYSWSTILKYLYGWAELPWLIFLWCAITIFIFSVLYLWGDIIARDGTLVESYLDKLYFSGVTFTTLGYGDFSPIGGTRLLAFLESFLGVFFIALFIFSFARRTAGR